MRPRSTERRLGQWAKLKAMPLRLMRAGFAALFRAVAQALQGVDLQHHAVLLSSNMARPSSRVELQHVHALAQYRPARWHRQLHTVAGAATLALQKIGDGPSPQPRSSTRAPVGIRAAMACMVAVSLIRPPGQFGGNVLKIGRIAPM